MLSADKVPLIAVIVPCYNEQEILNTISNSLTLQLRGMMKENRISGNSFVIFVDDGSTDATWSVIKKLASGNDIIHGIRLSANRGQQTALMAGLNFCNGKCDACITIDADLQDDVNAIPSMVEAFMEGADVVCGVRNARATDSWFKRNSAQSFYRVMKLLGADCLYNHADYRLLSARAINDLLQYGERNLFLRGLIPRLGYKQVTVNYGRKERSRGVTKYSTKKMFEFAIDGITSFSVKPVRMLFWLGLFFMVAALAIGIYTLIRYFSGETVEGWSSLILSIWFCTGILLMGMGIMGEYIGKIYIEVKQRPRYNIAEEI